LNDDGEDSFYQIDSLLLLDNDKLLEELDLSGYITNSDDVAGVFIIIPNGMINAEDVARITGYPIDLTRYLNYSKKF
jgi:hypothetical protein